MMQPATAQLGRSKAGLAIGYRLLDLGRNQVQAWTRQGVSATGIPGNYAASVDAPQTGGYIVWGLANQDLAEAPITPEPPTVDTTPAMLDAIRAMLAEVYNAIVDVMPKTPVIQMDTQPFEQGVNELRQTVDGQVSEINATLAAVREQVGHLQLLNDAATNAEIIRTFRDKFTEILGDQAPVVRLVNDNTPSELRDVLEMVRRDVDRLSETTDGVITEQAAKERIRKAAEALDRFKAQVGGKR